jgi:hypothetical protein
MEVTEVIIELIISLVGSIAITEVDPRICFVVPFLHFSSNVTSDFTLQNYLYFNPCILICKSFSFNICMMNVGSIASNNSHVRNQMMGIIMPYLIFHKMEKIHHLFNYIKCNFSLNYKGENFYW